jgi:hypothetical protein
MKIYSFSETEEEKNQKEEDLNGPMTFSRVEKLVRELSVMCNVIRRNTEVVVQVDDNVGTTQFMASAQSDFFTLKKISYKVDRRGNTTLYHIKTVG